MSRIVIVMAMGLTLAGCNSGQKDKDPLAERDGAVSAALDDPIMADPDLSTQNRGNSALSGGGPATGEIPPDKRTPEEAERARQAARDLLGGEVAPAPGPVATAPESRLARAATMQGVAEALKLGGGSCAAKIGYGFGWAARLPQAVPIYPRGHARVAAGTDDAGCHLRVVRFVSPVGVQDLVDFYFATGRKAGLAPRHTREGGDEVVVGGEGNESFSVFVRQTPDGMSEADLAISGLE